MKALLNLLKSLVIGGIVFLIPIGIVIVVMSKLLMISHQVGDKLNKLAFGDSWSETTVLAVAVGILMLIALAAGLFARTRAGRAIFVWLEGAVLARLPIYTVLRQMIADMSGSVDRLSDGGEVRVVQIMFDDHSQIGFAVDRAPDGREIVFIPGSPSALSGTVVIVEQDRVKPTKISATQVINGMRRLGGGISGTIKSEG